MTRIAVLVSGGGTNFRALIRHQQTVGFSDAALALCLSSRADAGAIRLAEEAAIPVSVVPRDAYATRGLFTDAIIHVLDAHRIDLVVLAGFQCILGAALFSRWENAVINVHPALIPAFCGDGYYGLHTHRAVLDYGVKLTGATVHFVTPETDAGPIILQRAIPVMPDDTPEALQRRVMEECEWQLLPEAVSLYCEGRLRVNGRLVTIL